MICVEDEYVTFALIQGVWDVKRDCRDSIEGSILDVYVNVAFSKRTVWKGLFSIIYSLGTPYSGLLDLASYD